MTKLKSLPRKLSGACLDLRRAITAVNAFFKDRDEQNQPYTYTGLALALDVSPSTLRRYLQIFNEQEAEDGAMDKGQRAVLGAIKRAHMRITDSYEQDLRSTQGVKPVGPIFALKAADNWRDSDAVDLSALGPAPTLIINISTDQGPKPVLGSRSNPPAIEDKSPSRETDKNKPKK